MNKIEALLKSKTHVNIELGCGDVPQAGFINMDMRKRPGVDIVHDLESFPWPLPDACADLLMASHIVEHINPHKGIFIKFMDEAWRVLKPGGQLMIATPYAGSMGYYQDPTHVNPCNEVTWYYFDPLQNIDGQNLYHHYRPKPWKVETISWKADSNMEVLMSKRRDDVSYH